MNLLKLFKQDECQFSFPFDGTSEEIYNKMKALIEQKGGSIEGDSTQGEITFKKLIVLIKATYSIINQEISFKIQKNRLNIGCEEIESEIRKALFN